MKIDISLTEEDFLRFNIFQAFDSQSGKRACVTRRTGTAIAAVVFIVCIFLKVSDLRDALIASGVFAVCAVLWEVTARARLTRKLKKQIAAMGKSGSLPFAGETVLEFSDSGITETRGETQTPVSWEDIVSFDETNGCFYVWFGAAQAFVIPLRCVEDRDGLRKLLMEKV